MIDKTPPPEAQNDPNSTEPVLEIEITDAGPDEDIEGMHTSEGLEIVIGDGPAPDAVEHAFEDNMAEYLDRSKLNSLAQALVAEYDQDENDRSDWMTTFKDGLKLLGLKYERKSEPWEDACGVYHPMLAEAVVRFQSEAMTETFPASGPVKTRIIGKETPQRTEAAARVREDMNYQLTEVMPEFRGEHERMLWSLPLAGSAFKKVYKDPGLGRQTSVFVPAEDLVLPYNATSLFSAQRITHIIRLTKPEMLRMQASGFYRDVELSDPQDNSPTIDTKAAADGSAASAVQDNRYKVLEMHVDLWLPDHDLDDPYPVIDGVPVPYIISIEQNSNEVLSLRRNWEQDDEFFLRRQHFAHYQYIPGFGAYGYGLLHLIGGYARSATLLLRMLVDAGTLSNLPGGLKSKGLRVKNEDTPIGPGEFRDVDVGSGTIKDNVMPLPYKEPSVVLAGLLDKIIQEGRAFASGGDLNVSDMSAQAPVGTTMALLERTLKVISAVQARLHHAMRMEFKLLKSVIANEMDDAYEYEPEEGERHSRREDYAMVEVLPVSDPNAATMAQKIVQYQAVQQLASSAPQVYNLPFLHRQMIEVLGVKNADKLVPIEDDLIPLDPVQENQNILTGKPVKAFVEQDHRAHLAVHMMAMQDPQIMQIVGQSPNAQAVQAAAMAHIHEHMSFEYRRQIEERLGMPLPTEEETKHMAPEVAAKVAQLVAKAAQQVLQGNQQQAAQEKAQQQAQDPVLQMQMAKVENETKKVMLQAQKMQVDAAAKADELRLREGQITLDAIMKMAKQALDARKQTSDEELKEQEIRLKTMHYGNMGRAQDQQILQQDRDRALEALRTLAEIHERNSIGESRPDDPDTQMPLPGMGGDQ
jgi:hypothetical protein